MTVGFIRRDNVGVGREDKFEKAAHYTSESGHRLVYEVARRVEEPGRCIGRIEWGSLDGHMIWSPPTEFRFPGGGRRSASFRPNRGKAANWEPRTGSREPCFFRIVAPRFTTKLFAPPDVCGSDRPDSV